MENMFGLIIKNDVSIRAHSKIFTITFCKISDVMALISMRMLNNLEMILAH